MTTAACALSVLSKQPRARLQSVQRASDGRPVESMVRGAFPGRFLPEIPAVSATQAVNYTSATDPRSSSLKDPERMPKALTISGMVVAVSLLLTFGLDLAVGVPFGKASQAMDIAFLICAALLGYVSWNTYREQA